MKITYTDIKRFLNQCVFNPKKSGPLSIIADVGNPSYYELRACEFIKEAPLIPFKHINHAAWLNDYSTNIEKAIQLLALAREIRASECFITTESNDEPKSNIKTTTP